MASTTAMTVGGWEIAAIAVKWLLYTATFTGVGGALFFALFGDAVSVTQRRTILRWVNSLCMAGLLIGTARIGVLAGALDGAPAAMVDPDLLALVFSHGEGNALLLRSAGLVVAMSSLACAGHCARAFAVIAVAFVAASSTQVGHVLDLKWMPVAQLLLAAHIAGLCYWLGALVPLWLCCGDTGAAPLVSLMRRFGHIAIYIVTTLVFGGVGLMIMLWSGAVDPAGSSYFRLLLAKLALVCLLLALAALNKLVLVPRLEHDSGNAITLLRSSIAAEIAVASMILLSVAVLTSTMSPVSE